MKKKLAPLATLGPRDRQSPDWLLLRAKPNLSRLATLGAALALASIPGVAQACDVCMGGKPNIRPAVNGAIFFMLGMVAMMATCVGFFMRYLARRARMPLSPTRNSCR